MRWKIICIHFAFCFWSIPVFSNYVLVEIDTIPQYFFLKSKLDELKKNVKMDIWDTLYLMDSAVEKGNNKLLKKLNFFGYFKNSDLSNISEEEITDIIKDFQFKNGIDSTGKPDKQTIKLLNIGIAELMVILDSNMKRASRIPEMQTFQVWVNIPEFMLKVYEKNQLILSSKVIVGKKNHKTTSINSKFKWVVFNPYWNIPESIVKKEIYHKLITDKAYLEKNKMEWVHGNLRQKPGKLNPLGQIKFLFPNDHSIYLHDTPNKKLFLAVIRSFSHGCIRVEKAFELADFLLSIDGKYWNKEASYDILKSGMESYFQVKKQVFVNIHYLTAFVDENGILHLLKDIYRLDKPSY